VKLASGGFESQRESVMFLRKFSERENAENLQSFILDTECVWREVLGENLRVPEIEMLSH
jgi:hypothetical protein